MIQLPDTTKGHGLVLVRGTYHTIHYEDGKQKRTNTKTADWNTALRQRDIIHRRLKKDGATVKRKLTPTEKLASGRDNLYIHHRQPFLVVVKGKKVGEFATRKLAREARDKFLGNSETRFVARSRKISGGETERNTPSNPRCGTPSPRTKPT